MVINLNKTPPSYLSELFKESRVIHNSFAEVPSNSQKFLHHATLLSKGDTILL